MTPYRWNAATEVWEFFEPAFGGWCTLRYAPHESSRPMTFAEGIRHLMLYPLVPREREPETAWLRDRAMALDIRYEAAGA